MFDRSESIRARLRSLPALVVAVLLVWWVLVALIYRSGAYFLLAEPESNAGAMVNALLLVERQYQPQARNVLVLGDSRVAEGFSGQIAGADTPLHFIVAAVPGSTPRSWYYLLRELQRRGHAFEAVVIGIGSVANGSRLADWPLSPLQDSPLLGWRDVFDYPASFATPELRARARRAVWFPAYNLRADTVELLKAPTRRWQRARQTRELYLDAVFHYPGREESMPALALVAGGAGQVVADWGQASADQQPLIEAHLAEVQSAVAAPLLVENASYLRTWLGALSALCQGQDARLIAFALPRGPYPAAYVSQQSVLPTLTTVAGLELLPADLLQSLEGPQFFFDTVHANRQGRAQISARVGAAVAGRLPSGGR
ncbi:MAG: hypothetical protein AB7E72_19140 [Lysobacterales bacterium]